MCVKRRIACLTLLSSEKAASGRCQLPDGEIEWDTSKPDGTPKKLLDVERINKLGWEAKIGLDEGIGMVYEDYVCGMRLSGGINV